MSKNRLLEDFEISKLLLDFFNINPRLLTISTSHLTKMIVDLPHFLLSPEEKILNLKFTLSGLN